MTPTARTLAHARKLGFLIGVVERYNSFTRQRADLFGFVDLIACRPGVGVIGIQATTGDHHAERKAKILTNPDLPTILASGLRVELWTWSKRGDRGKRKCWTLRREEITADAPAPVAESEGG